MAEDTSERKESVKWNLDYFKSCPGYCKLILIVSLGFSFEPLQNRFQWSPPLKVTLLQVLNLLAFISASVASSKYTANAQVTIFLFVSMISFWISLFIVCFYLFRFDEKLDTISFSTFVSSTGIRKLIARDQRRFMITLRRASTTAAYRPSRTWPVHYLSSFWAVFLRLHA